MSKELEALENIKREAGMPYFSTLYDIDMWREDFKTVETALKALEIIKEKVPLIYLLAGFVGKYDPKEIELIKEVYLND